jgi:dihydroorotase
MPIFDNVEDIKNSTGVPGIKIFMGSNTGDLLVDEQAALERIFAETTLPICVHCEDENTVRANQARLGPNLNVEDHSRIRDHFDAGIASRRALDRAFRDEHRFHVLHVSTAQEIPIIQDHCGWITAEVCPHHWCFNINDYKRLESLIQMNPSIKTAQENQALWNALFDGKTRVVPTDQAPHTLEEKQQPYPISPSGLPAVENYFALLPYRTNRGVCQWPHIAGWTSDAPARIWGSVGKRRIAVGYDADLVLVDPISSERSTTRNSGPKQNGPPGTRKPFEDGRAEPGAAVALSTRRKGVHPTT